MRWGTESLDCIERLRANAATIRVPLLVVHGGADPLNHPDGARWLHGQTDSDNTTLKIYPEGFHEPHNDFDFRQVCADVVSWLERQLMDRIGKNENSSNAGP